MWLFVFCARLGEKCDKRDELIVFADRTMKLLAMNYSLISLYAKAMAHKEPDLF
jgi:hypothetical protein